MAGMFDDLFKKRPKVNAPTGLLGASPSAAGDPAKMAQQMMSQNVASMTPSFERDPNPVAKMTEGIMARTPVIGVGAPERQAPMGQQRGILGRVADVATGIVPQTLLASPDRLNALAQALGKTTATPMSTAQRVSTGLLAGSAAEKENEKALLAADIAGVKRGEERQATLFSQEGSLRDKYVQRSKNYASATEGYSKLRFNALNAGSSGASDVALVFGFMKTIDPNSTVREGEFATAEQTAGIPDRIVNLYNNLRTGERLNQKQRIEFLKAGENQYFALQKAQMDLEDEYNRLANAYGLDASRVVRPLSQTYEPAYEDPATISIEQLNSAITVGDMGNPVIINRPEQAADLRDGTYYRVAGENETQLYEKLPDSARPNDSDTTEKNYRTGR
jgi:hypothetical protein